MGPRSYFLDILRGFTIVLMAIFHFSYDLNMLGLYAFSMKTPFWYYFPRLIVFFFLICVGVSLHLANKEGIHWGKVGRRFRKIALCAIGISASTYFLFPQNWIYFGTLHCIAASSLLGLLFINRKMLSGAVIILIISTYLYFDLDTSSLAFLPHIVSMDFIPLYPWFWVVLLGQIFSEQIAKISFSQNALTRALAWMGKRSLIIYLIHQPLILSILWPIAKLMNK